MVTVGCIYDENVITYIVMGCTFAVFFIGLAIFAVAYVKLYNRFINERVAELEEEFCDMPFEEAEQILKERGIITDIGFIIKNDDVFGEEVLSFNEAQLGFGYSIANTKICPHVCLGVKGQLMFDNTKAFYEMDRALYNFILKSDFNFNKGADLCFELFKNNKKEFTKFALKYHRNA